MDGPKSERLFSSLLEQSRDKDLPEQQIKRSAILFSQFTINLLKRNGFSTNEPPKDFILGDIGCSEGVEISSLITELSANLMIPTSSVRVLALDPDENVQEVYQWLNNFETSKENVTVIQDSGANPDAFNAIKKDVREKFNLFVFRNPDTHSRTQAWKDTFINAYKNLSVEGFFVVTCANETELERATKMLISLDLTLSVYDTSPNTYTHTIHNEDYWIVARKK